MMNNLELFANVLHNARGEVSLQNMELLLLEEKKFAHVMCIQMRYPPGVDLKLNLMVCDGLNFESGVSQTTLWLHSSVYVCHIGGLFAV